MFAPLVRKLLGSKNDRELKRMGKVVVAINAQEEGLNALSDEQLKAKTGEFKQRLADGATLDQLLPEAFAVVREAGKRVMGSTFASNVSRLQTLGDVARETGRQVCVAGRSLDRIIEVSQDNGYLQDFPDPVDFDTAMGLPRGEVLIIATGGQGEPRAELARVADENHPIELVSGDVVLFSSRQIPGNELSIGIVQNKLAARGITMVTDRQSMIHVSGHPGRPELQALYEWLKARHQIDFSRKLTSYIEPWSSTYIDLLISEDYAPDMEQLMRDYLHYNPTRNKALDLLPLFAHLDKELLAGYVKDPRIKSRPTLHYRLPDCDIDNPHWHFSTVWNDWVVLEQLAAHPEDLADLRSRFREAQKFSFHNLTIIVIYFITFFFS